MNKIRVSRTDWSDVVGWIVLGLLFALFAGEPDLMSAIIARVQGGA